MSTLGIMQGRLSSPLDGRIQSFPRDTWQDEFFIADTLGLSCIEWVCDDDATNPLYSASGVMNINRIIKKSGVKVLSVCADCFMTQRLIDPNGMIDRTQEQFLLSLLFHAAQINAQTVVLPFVDQSALKTLREFESLAVLFREIQPYVRLLELRLALETDWIPEILMCFTETYGPEITANFDTGNRCSQNYDPENELTIPHYRLRSVHLKDRKRDGGTTVRLGTGNVKFRKCFDLFRNLNFDGPFILQPARIEGMNEIDQTKLNMKFMEPFL